MQPETDMSRKGMWARSVTARGAPEVLDEVIPWIQRDVEPAITQMAGCLGLSLLTEPETGRCIVTSSWHSREAMKASENGVQGLRARGAQMFGGELTVQEWEIAFMHRAQDVPPGAAARVTWVRMDPGSLDTNMATFRAQMLPRIEKLDGFCSFSMLVDRERGLLVSSGAMVDREALSSSRQEAEAIRDAARQAYGVEILEVAEMDLVLAHLRVPELV